MANRSFARVPARPVVPSNFGLVVVQKMTRSGWLDGLIYAEQLHEANDLETIKVTLHYIERDDGPSDFLCGAWAFVTNATLRRFT